MSRFQLAENTGFFFRLGLIGPSGSGKSYTALKVATELGYERIGIIDTENRSARRYARSFSRRFQSLELDQFSPRDYIEAIRQAQEAGFEVLVIDSLSHAWMGRGGVLEMVDQSAKRQARGSGGSSFNGWREVTPEHNALVQSMLQCRMHLIVTMRVKTEYVVELDARGKSVPRKVGLAPVQREGLEYEFDVVGDIEPVEHEMVITKNRCPALDGLVVKKPGKELALALRAWVDGGEGPAPAAAEQERPADRERPDFRGPDDLPSPAEVDKLRAQEARADVIAPWLASLKEVEQIGDEAQLTMVREELNKALPRKTKEQGAVIRSAIERAKAAIKARLEAVPADELAEAAEMAEMQRREQPGLGNQDT